MVHGPSKVTNAAVGTMNFWRHGLECRIECHSRRWSKMHRRDRVGFQSHSLSTRCFFQYDLLFFRQEEYSIFHFGPRTLLSVRKWRVAMLLPCHAWINCLTRNEHQMERTCWWTL